MRRAARLQRPRAILAIAVVGLAAALLAIAAGHAGWYPGPVVYRAGPVPRPASPPDVGIQYLGYPYGVAVYPTVPDENRFVCFGDVALRTHECVLLFEYGAGWTSPVLVPGGVPLEAYPVLP